MNTEQPPHRKQLQARWNRGDAQLRGIGSHARRTTRRWLVASYLALVVADSAAAMLLQSRFGLVLMVSLFIAVGLLTAMNNATRHAADNTGALDEMLTRIRDRYRAGAYRILVPLCMAACVVLVSLTDPLLSPALGITLSKSIVDAIVWLLFLIAPALPTLIAGWTVPDIDDPAE